MESISSTEELRKAIIELESIQDIERMELREHFKETYEYHKPSRILKRSISNAVSSVDVKENAISIFLGLAYGYIGKKVIIGSSRNPIKRLLGNVLVLGLSNYVAKNPEVGRTVETVVMTIARSVMGGMQSNNEEEE